MLKLLSKKSIIPRTRSKNLHHFFIFLEEGKPIPFSIMLILFLSICVDVWMVEMRKLVFIFFDAFVVDVFVVDAG